MKSNALRLVRRDEEPVIVSGRYEVLDERPIGRGTWGQVWKIRDTETDETLAAKVLVPTDVAKRQMVERGLDPRKILIKEGSFTPANRVVPRRFEIDDNGTPFIVMPLFKGTLASRLEGNIHVGYGLSQERAIKWLKQMAEGIKEFHDNYHMAHADLKFDNFLVDANDGVFLNDLGTATCASVGMSESPRDNMGFELTRPPENYREGNHPDYASDSWSFGSLATRMWTGDYLLGSYLRNAKDIGVFYEQNGDGIERLIRKQLKDSEVPRSMRKFIEGCTRFNARFRTEYLKEGLEVAVERLNNWSAVKRSLRLWPGVAVAGVLSLMVYGAYVHEPMDLTLPKPEMRGMLYPRPPREDEIVEFDVEDIPYEKRLPITGFMGGQERMAKLCTDNRIVAYLTKAYAQAMTITRGIGGPREYTEHQHRVFMAYTTPSERKDLDIRSGPMWPIFAKSIEFGLKESKTKEGKVDLEDVMAITRVGTGVVSHAKRVSGSGDYVDYVKARDTDGNLIIPEKEQEFIKEWLNYFHSDS